MKQTLKVVFVIMGTLIGAGFASGKEIYLFFGQYGTWGLLGILISSLLTGYITYKVLMILVKKKVDNYKQLIDTIGFVQKRKKTKIILNSIVNSFMVISFFIMVAGFSAYIHQTWPQIPIYLASFIFVGICFLLFCYPVDGIVKVSEILVPLLIGTILYLGIKNIPFIYQTFQTELTSYPSTKSPFTIQCILSSILYASYNSILLIPVLTSLRKSIICEKQVKKISFFTVIFVLLLSLCIFSLLTRGNFYVQELELPLLEIVKEFGPFFKTLYGFIIMVSIFTSAIATGFSLLENIAKNKKDFHKKRMLLCTFAILISYIGFANLVSFLYPIFGVLGIFQMILL